MCPFSPLLQLSGQADEDVKGWDRYLSKSGQRGESSRKPLFEKWAVAQTEVRKKLGLPVISQSDASAHGT